MTALGVFADSVSGPGALPPIELSILSRQGGRDYNEDACGHWHSDQYLCCVVADGAGGHGGGDIAARLAVRHVLEQCAAAPLLEPADVSDLLIDTNAQVLRHQANGGVQADMHSTIVALFIDLVSGQALWGHAGDSRLYVFRGGQMLAHTRDHSVVQSLVEAGLLGADQMRKHPQRSELLSALGTDPGDLKISAATRPWSLRPGDAFLLCTDGLWEYVDEAEISAALARAGTPADWLGRLEQLVLRHAAELGKSHHDNFSGIAVWIGGPLGLRPPRLKGNPMPMNVCTGAMMSCTFGAAPSVFNATPKMIMTSEMPAGNIMDNIPIENVPPFGVCLSVSNPEVAAATAAALGVLTPQPCVPVLPAPWAPGAPTVLLNNFPALDNSSVLTCAWGGVITFSDPGQFTHQVP